mmetsp:Transcript_7629/g.9776  ORF Transcript_7629/g.9776 Transcript_7629/m.9776 type:complete len:92 (-) Transcript_7629:2-277(-)
MRLCTSNAKILDNSLIMNYHATKNMKCFVMNFYHVKKVLKSTFISKAKTMNMSTLTEDLHQGLLLSNVYISRLNVLTIEASKNFHLLSIPV